MKLNVNSWYNEFYKFMYSKTDNQLPKGFCEYFWKLVWVFISLPMTWIGAIITRLTKDYTADLEAKSVLTLGYYLFMAIGWIILVPAKLALGVQIPLIIISPIIIVGLIVCLCFTIWMIFQGIGKLRKKKITSEKTVSSTLVLDYIRAKKNKMCPRIEWEFKK